MSLRDKNPVLLLVDIQQGFVDEAYWGGNRNNPDAERIAGTVLERWRSFDLPRVHVRHSSTNPHSPLHETHEGFAIHQAVSPQDDELVITKNVNSAFIGTDLYQLLEEMGASTLVIAGLTTDHCISTTVRMAGNLGFETLVLSDATATFDKQDIYGDRISSDTVHQVHLASLQDEFAQVIGSQELFEIL